MGASGVGPVMKKAEMPRVLVDTEKGKEHFSSFLAWLESSICLHFCVTVDIPWKPIATCAIIYSQTPCIVLCWMSPLVSTRKLVRIGTMYNTCMLSAGQSPASSELVLIAPIPPSESLDIHLMALTADGRRFYLSTQLVSSVAAAPGRRTPSVLRNVRSRSAIPAPQHQGQSRCHHMNFQQHQLSRAGKLYCIGGWLCIITSTIVGYCHELLSPWLPALTIGCLVRHICWQYQA